MVNLTVTRRIYKITFMIEFDCPRSQYLQRIYLILSAISARFKVTRRSHNRVSKPTSYDFVVNMQLIFYRESDVQ